jgi:hypothetical protein
MPLEINLPKPKKKTSNHLGLAAEMLTTKLLLSCQNLWNLQTHLSVTTEDEEDGHKGGGEEDLF